LTLLFNARRLAAIIDRNEIDIIHMHWGKDLAMVAIAKSFSKRKPRLVYTRQMMITRSKSDFYHRFLYSQVDLILTITKQLELLCKEFIRSPRTEIRTLYYGVKQPEKIYSAEEIIELRTQKGFTGDDFIIGLFGRLEDGKGQHLLIRALASFKDQPNVRALIVGHEMEAGYRDELSQLAAGLGVDSKIIFNDFVQDPQTLMQICDCICLTSYEETFGLVLPEAMRAGIAVIGSNSGGVPEIIEHMESGLLFNARDEYALYKQIEYYYQNPEHMKMIAHQGKQRADELFDNDRHFETLESTFEALTQP
jgi:glycosyltransferase involved in cell wall biosynthesis